MSLCTQFSWVYLVRNMCMYYIHKYNLHHNTEIVKTRKLCVNMFIWNYVFMCLYTEHKHNLYHYKVGLRCGWCWKINLHFPEPLFFIVSSSLHHQGYIVTSLDFLKTGAESQPPPPVFNSSILQDLSDFLLSFE